jgi:hypothetical protein
MKGRFMRVRCIPWVADIAVVRTTVATNPHRRTLGPFI